MSYLAKYLTYNFGYQGETETAEVVAVTTAIKTVVAEMIDEVQAIQVNNRNDSFSSIKAMENCEIFKCMYFNVMNVNH